MAGYQSPLNRNDLIHCDNCGEDYSVTYKRCPFCDERPSQSGAGSPSGAGRRAAGKRRGGGYGGPANPVQIAMLVLSVVLILAAAFIVVKSLSPLFGRGEKPPVENPSVSTPAVLPESVTLDRTEITLASGEEFTLGITIAPDGVVEPVLWTSSDPSVASVDDQGKITNLNTGSEAVTVTITAACLDKEAQCQVTCAGVEVSQGGGEDQPDQNDPPQDDPPVSTSGKLKPGTDAVVVNASGGLRIRSGPGTTYEVKDSTENGAHVTIAEDAGNGWYKIKYNATGGKIREGYLKYEYLEAAKK